MDQKNAVAISDVSDAGAAGHGGSSPSPGPMPEKNIVVASDVNAAAATVGASGHGCSSSSRSLAAVDVSPLPLLSDFGDPFEDFPAFNKVVSDEEPEVLPQTNLYSEFIIASVVLAF